MLEFFSKLFDTSDFPARWHCGHWTAGHGWLHVLSDLGVWSAYVAIPCVLGYFVLRRRNIPFRGIFLLFGAFILACGATHLMEALVFWWPAYRLAAVLKLVTAVASWGTVVALVPVAPKVLAMRSPEELEREIRARKGAELALQRTNDELQRQIEAFRQSEERFRILVEGTKDYALFTLDPAGRIDSWNAGALRLLQYPAHEIVGESPSRFLLTEDVNKENPKRPLEIAMAEGRFEEEGWRVRKDGSRFWANVLLTVHKAVDGTVRGFSNVIHDISERNAAEENARRLLEEETARRTAEQYASVIEAQRERLAVTLASIGDGVITTDAQGRVMLLNPVAEHLTGWQNDDAVGQPVETVFHIIDEITRQPAENPAVRLLRDGRAVDLVHHTALISRDGVEWPIGHSVAPIKNERGDMVGVVLVHRDVTEERRAEEAARRNREVLSLVHQIGKVGHFDWNPLTDETTWSPEQEALYGLAPGQFEGGYQAWAKMLHPDDVDEASEIVRRALTTGKYMTEFRVIWPDGSVHWIEARAHVFKNEQGNPSRFLGVNMDITQRKQQEEALRASEERWRTVTESLPNLIWSDSPDGLCDWLSGQWKSYTGLHEDQLLGLRWLDAVIHPEDRDRTLECWRRACADEAVYDLEYRIRRHDGEYHWFKTRGVPVRDERGNIVYWFGTCTDIEDVKRLEAALRDADRRKDEFLATLAHELRNPLAPIRNAVELLRHASQDPDVIEMARGILERQLSHMVRLIDDLLDIARISNGKLQLRKERIGLSAAVQSAVEETRSLIEGQSHQLTLAMPTDEILLDADPVRLAQVFSNLLNNAAKYTDIGGHIWLTAERKNGAAVVTVRDTGIGIEADHLPRIFEMFSQAAPALERSQGGLGVGLSLVRGLVELHGGCVSAQSEGKGAGSEFIVRLPAAPGVVESVGREPFADDKSLLCPRTYRILLVEDNADTSASLAIILGRLGHAIEIVQDGLEAVQAAVAFKPDVVLLDIGLPKLNGYDAARLIREREKDRRIAIIAMTGWGQEEDKRRAFEAGIDHHLTKPVEPAALMRILAQLRTF